MDLVINGMNEELIECKTCRKFTNQLLISEQEELVIKGGDTLFQEFRCGECQRTNTRLLHLCYHCEKHTEQILLHENDDVIMADTLEQEFQCKTCGYHNDSWRYTDGHLERWLNAKDEKEGVYCETCMAYKIQTLINKEPSRRDDVDFDLTTYKCKTCGKANYGTEEKKNIR